MRPTPNPLRPRFSRPPEKYPDWRAVYERPWLPFHIDLGCGKGNMVHRLAQEHPEVNFLGIELQEERIKVSERLPNLAFFPCNVSIVLEPLLQSFADQRVVGDGRPMLIKRFTICFPDPWFKRRHHKRRMVTPLLAHILHRSLTDEVPIGQRSSESTSSFSSDGRPEVYLETDYLEGFVSAQQILQEAGFEEHAAAPFRFGKTGTGMHCLC